MKFFIRRFFLVILFCSASLIEAKESKISKQKQWENVSNSINLHGYCEIGGGAENKDLAIALTLMGIPTASVCGGHLDLEPYCPKINIVPAETEKARKFGARADTFQIKIDEQEKRIKELYPELSWRERYSQPEMKGLTALYKKYHNFIAKAERERLPTWERLYSLLNAFYEDRSVEYDVRLVVSLVGGALTNTGAVAQSFRTEEERAQKLEAYKAEMKAFEAFVKKRVFSKK